MLAVLLDVSVSCFFGMLSTTHVHRCAPRPNTPGRLYAGFTCHFLLWIALIFCYAVFFLRRHVSGLFCKIPLSYTVRDFFPLPADFRAGVRVKIDWSRIHIFRRVFALLVF